MKDYITESRKMEKQFGIRGYNMRGSGMMDAWARAPQEETQGRSSLWDSDMKTQCRKEGLEKVVEALNLKRERTNLQALDLVWDLDLEVSAPSVEWEIWGSSSDRWRRRTVEESVCLEFESRESVRYILAARGRRSTWIWWSRWWRYPLRR